MFKYLKGSENPFPATNHISGHFRPCGRPWCHMSKIAKITILAKNSNFHSMAGSVRESDIWPGMSPWGVLESFCTRNRYLNPFRSNFKQFWKNRFFFLGFFNCGSSQKMGRRIFYGSRNFDVEISTGPKTSYLFEKKNAAVRFYPFLT